MYEEDVEDFEYDFDGEEPDEDFDASDEENGDATELRIDPYRIFRKQYPPEKTVIPGCNLNETIQRHFESYLATESESAWNCFLSASEPLINRYVSAFEAQYHIKGCFEDLKGAFVLGLTTALQNYDAGKDKVFFDYAKNYARNEMHRFVRTCYYRHSIHSDYQYRVLRNVMRRYHDSGALSDEKTIQSIAAEVKITPSDTQDYLQAGFRNEQFLNSIYTHSDSEEEDEDVSCEKLVGSDTLNPETVYFLKLRSNAVLDAFDSLTYREREMVAMELSFCPECLRPLMEKGKNGVRKPKPLHTESYISMAEDFELIDGDSAKRILKGAYDKMRRRLKASPAFEN